MNGSLYSIYRKRGKNTACPELQQMLSELQEDDVVLVHEIKSLNESWFDTSSENPMNEFLLNIFGSLAQLERGLTLQR